MREYVRRDVLKRCASLERIFYFCTLTTVGARSPNVGFQTRRTCAYRPAARLRVNYVR